ncbi:hypothetical protein [Streptomyces violens]|uniref:hypothetical protein n=1 Tax=Streptomyces violens TaxID=66377 RepID=UPI0004BFB631|nr:hypothetical protein [Streptomyces violens]
MTRSSTARVFAHEKGLLPDPKLDEKDWHDVWAEWQQILTEYNGAVEYGRRALDLYKIFEGFNARLRG